MAHKSWERQRMSSALCEASTLVRSLADPATAGYSVKAAIGSAANKLAKFNRSFNRVRDVWYARPKVAISADEMAELKRAARIKQLEAEANDETAILRKRLEELERQVAFLRHQDEAFHGPAIEALGVQAAGLVGKTDE